MYKHVVQNVEKFISKSKPTYKVTGLYVIDALIRKSQSEFGPDKDVYTKRFQKNMLQTFQHLAKSAISSSDKEKCKKIVFLWRKAKIYEESLLDELDSIITKTTNSSKTDAVGSKLEPNPPADDAEVLISTILSNPESEMAQNLAKMLGGPQQEQLQQILAKMKHNEPESQNTEAIQDKSPLFDEIDRNNSWQEGPPPLPPLPSAHGKSIPISTIPPPNDWHQHHPPPQPVVPPPGAWPDPPARLPSPKHDRDYSRDRRRSRSPRRDFSPRKDRSRSRDRDIRRRRRTRSRSRERDRKRSRSRDRDSRRDRHRRRSRSRERRSSRRDEISNREKMCLPSTKDGKGCVASRTIWIGNISKGDCTEESVKNMIKNVDRVDDIQDITALHSRGCAYVVMKTRAAAFKTLQKLASKRGREEKRKVDWAINSGLKDAEMQAYFDKAEGAAFIEYSKLPDDIEVLIKWAHGGVIDIESMPEKVQQAIAEKDRQNSQSVDMEMDMDEKETSSQPMPNATTLPMLAGMPSMTIPMAMPLGAQLASAQMPIPPRMGQHPLQGAPMMMRHQGLILPQGGMLPQGGNMPPGASMMGFIPRERFPRPGGFPPRGPGNMADNHWNGANHGMGGPRQRGERFQSPGGRFPDDRSFDGGRGSHRGGQGSWPRGHPHPRQNFNDRDGHQPHAHRDWQNGPDRWGNAHAERGTHHRGDRFRNEPRSPSRGFSRPSPSHSPAAHNPWGGSQSHSNGAAAWIPPEIIKQEKSSFIEYNNSNDENAQSNGWINETRNSEEKHHSVPNNENNINENVPQSIFKSEINHDQLPPDPPNEIENSATTPIHDEPNTNDANSPVAAKESVSAESAVPAMEKSIYDPDSLLNSTVNSSVDEGAGEPSTAESTEEIPAQSTAISSPGNN